ncbi:MAG: T9SS type A sorting domain-containing protein [Paludibacter sp.]|nr:T9SS type A sorting domain-containing protein [Paludibacter sp.]
MKKITLLIILFFAVFSASATISWMGNHTTGSQPSNSQTIHFYVEMYNSYSGCHAEVQINEGGTWVAHALTQGTNTNNGNNSTWSGDINVLSTSTAYYFHGWDDWNANVWDNNGGSNYSISINPTTKAVGNWSSSSSWCDGSLPTSTTASFVIAHNITLDQNVTVGSLSINSGSTFTTSDGTARTLVINKSGSGSSTTLVNSGTWANGTGGSTVIFTGAPSSGDAVHSISGTIGFQNITINKTGGSSNVGASFGANSSVSGTLEIGAGGYVLTAPPASFYDSNAILKFNQGPDATYNVESSDNSWSITQVPQNITITSGTVNLNANRTASGNLVIDGGALVLKNANSTNLTIQGNWTRSSGTFNANDGTVTLSGINDGTVNATGDATMNNLVISKTSGAKSIIDCNLNTSALTINSNAIFIVNAGKQLTVSTTMSNSGTLNLLSDNTNGTATITTPAIITNTSATYNVYQYLSTSRNWYMASPVTGASSLPIVNTGSLIFYSYPENEAKQETGADGYAPGAYWNTVSSGTMDVNKGYIIKPNLDASTVTFTGTSLNTNDQIISGLTYTSTNPKHGYNLIGNPYPSYLNVLSSITANTNLEATVWYKTRDTNSTPLYHFETVNATTGVGTNASGTGRVTGIIPPMQAFWVKTKVDNQSITLLNTNRSHTTSVAMTGFGNISTTPLKTQVEKNQIYPLLGLNVSNGTTGDETIVMFAAESSNGLDAYDSGKMNNNNVSIPEIYTFVGGQQLAINSMNNIPYDTEIPLGFTTGQAGINFNIRISQINNFDSGTKVLLKDNLLYTEKDITDGSAYNFSSDAVNSTTRFTLIFKTGSIVSGFDNNPADASLITVYKNAQNRITINCSNGFSGQGTVSVYNTIGEKMESQTMTNKTTVLSESFTSGVYLVRVIVNGKTITSKIIIN